MASGAETAPSIQERRIRVRAHELAPTVGQLDLNIQLITAAIADAVAAGIELLVLPELVTSGYYLRDVEEARAVGIAADNEHFARWCSMLPPEVTVVFGYCETAADRVYNSAVTLEASGVVGSYRKTHLWDDEKLIFTPGDSAPTVLDTAVGRLGTLICYDLEFPEMPRSLALAGAEVIAVPTNWPRGPRPEGERASEVVMAMAAARASAVAIICCDRTGTERGHAWTEGTTVIGTDGWPKASKDAAGKVDTTLVIRSDRTKIGPRNDVFEDRRPAIYQHRLRHASG